MALKKKLFLTIAIITIVLASIIGYFIINNDENVILEETSNELLNRNALAIHEEEISSEQQFDFGMSNGRFTNNDGLQFQNMSGGFMRVYDAEGNFIRRVGFGITSDQFNRSVNDFSWNWEYVENETVELYDDGEDTWYNHTVQKQEWIATYTGVAGTWVQTYDFSRNEPLKITHYVENQGVNLTNTKFWYVMTVNNEVAIYDGVQYDLNNDYHITQNVEGKIPRIQFPNDLFDFKDLLADNEVTDVFVGNATMFDLPNERILAVGMTRGNGNFNVGQSVFVDPSIQRTITSSDDAVNVTTSAGGYGYLIPYEQYLTAWVNFDYENSGTVIDRVTGNTGTFSGDGFVNTTNGYFGSSGEFDTSGDNLIFSDDSAYDATSNMTILTWIYARSLTTGTNENRIALKGAGSHNQNQWTFDVEDGLVLFELEGSFPSGSNLVSFTESINTGEWYCAAGTYDGTDVKTYLNGVENISTSRNTGSLAATNTNDFTVGGRPSGTDRFDGYIDDLFIFNKSLSQAEIAELCEMNRPLTASKGYFEFNNIDVGDTGSENMANVSIEYLQQYRNPNLTVSIGDVSGSTYSYGSEYSIDNTTFLASDIPITTPNNISVRVFYYPDVNQSFSPVSYTNVTITSWEAGGGGDTCTYSGSGNHEYDCSDNCVVSSVNDYGNSNITATGSGTLRFTANQNNIDYFIKSNSCTVIKNNGVLVG